MFRGGENLKPNWVDRLILGKRDPYRAVYLLRFIRLQYAWAVSMMVVVAFVGFLVWSSQQKGHKDCLTRNESARVSRQVLDQLVAASHADGDINAAHVWEQWQQRTSQASLPKC